VDSDQARQRAERLFKKEQRAQDGRAAVTEYEAEARATREKTERLKALRLASFCRETPGLNGGDPSYLDGLGAKCQ
jgi:hypothetical protein